MTEMNAQSSDDANLKANAMQALGLHYEKGFGVKKDYLEALKWYKKAVENGYTEAEKDVDRVNRNLNSFSSESSRSSDSNNYAPKNNGGCAVFLMFAVAGIFAFWLA